jgi:hypothetical protein
MATNHSKLHTVAMKAQCVVARWLRKNGWVVFYLPEEKRFCKRDPSMETCWMYLYNHPELRQSYLFDPDAPTIWNEKLK